MGLKETKNSVSDLDNCMCQRTIDYLSCNQGPLVETEVVIMKAVYWHIWWPGIKFSHAKNFWYSQRKGNWCSAIFASLSIHCSIVEGSVGNVEACNMHLCKLSDVNIFCADNLPVASKLLNALFPVQLYGITLSSHTNGRQNNRWTARSMPIPAYMHCKTQSTVLI